MDSKRRPHRSARKALVASTGESLLRRAFADAKAAGGRIALGSSVLFGLLVAAINGALDHKLNANTVYALLIGTVIALTAIFAYRYWMAPLEVAIDKEQEWSSERAELSSKVESLTASLEEATAAPVPVVQLLQGRDDPMVLMQVGTPPRYQPFAFGAAANSKSHPNKGAVAESARIELTVETLDGQHLIGPIWGRWRDAPSITQLTPTQLHTHTEAINLDPTEVEHEFDLGTKPEIESARWIVIDAKQSGYVVDDQKVRIRVRVVGKNFPDVSGVYVLETAPGLAFKVTLES